MNPIMRGIVRCLLLLGTCGVLAALPGSGGAGTGAPDQPGPDAAAGSEHWCRAYEQELLGLVNEVSESVLLNLRLAMKEAGAGAAQVERVLAIAKHPVIAAYVEQKHGRQVLGRYEGVLDAVGCLKR